MISGGFKDAVGGEEKALLTKRLYALISLTIIVVVLAALVTAAVIKSSSSGQEVVDRGVSNAPEDLEAKAAALLKAIQASGLLLENDSYELTVHPKPLNPANIAFNTPDSLGYGQHAEIQLLLSSTLSSTELSNQIQGPGPKQQETILSGKKMKATLIGPAFEITQIAPAPPEPPTQIVLGPMTKWEWDIRPKELGTQHLSLTIDAIIQSGDKELPHTIRSFKRDIEVAVVWPQSPLFFLQSNWQWVSTALLIPFAGWLLTIIFGSKKSAA
jgi:hypothetical protein